MKTVIIILFIIILFILYKIISFLNLHVNDVRYNEVLQYTLYECPNLYTLLNLKTKGHAKSILVTNCVDKYKDVTITLSESYEFIKAKKLHNRHFILKITDEYSIEIIHKDVFDETMGIGINGYIIFENVSDFKEETTIIKNEYIK